MKQAAALIVIFLMISSTSTLKKHCYRDAGNNFGWTCIKYQMPA
tara:strand:- start:544 stop:675 length:132 start_codon:yes stop_codon:yes gene_type:complete